jgi:hypothetical protein
MKVSVFATCNAISKISNALKSRFIVLQLQEYKYVLGIVLIDRSLLYSIYNPDYSILFFLSTIYKPDGRGKMFKFVALSSNLGTRNWIYLPGFTNLSAERRVLYDIDFINFLPGD